MTILANIIGGAALDALFVVFYALGAVSYTHLTLPTIV